MNNKKMVFVALVIVMMIGLSTVLVDANCCQMSQECCCPDFEEFGLELIEYVCVCVQGGSPLIWHDCIYERWWKYPGQF